MDTAIFSRINRARCEEWMKEGNTVLHHAVGLAGEVGELCNLIKKANRAQVGAVGGEVIDLEAVGNEIADIFIYLDIVASHYGVDLGQAVVKKFNATSVKHGFFHRLPEEEG